jgi:hypothetical protein
MIEVLGRRDALVEHLFHEGQMPVGLISQGVFWGDGSDGEEGGEQFTSRLCSTVNPTKGLSILDGKTRVPCNEGQNVVWPCRGCPTDTMYPPVQQII